ncbi:uncharacterized protein BcabD6B2_30330 [Babesia caballi]|uniref:Uncharacterized protein n=1 Tax=Babesia caballi TaxID=5871 RepID=A0AAV4LTV6_BABCB|nr:hypothetical protein BcabD6B2_30330 [Babesia caballi]
MCWHTVRRPSAGVRHGWVAAAPQVAKRHGPKSFSRRPSRREGELAQQLARQVEGGVQGPAHDPAAHAVALVPAQHLRAAVHVDHAAGQEAAVRDALVEVAHQRRHAHAARVEAAAQGVPHGVGVAEAVRNLEGEGCRGVHVGVLVGAVRRERGRGRRCGLVRRRQRKRGRARLAFVPKGERPERARPGGSSGGAVAVKANHSLVEPRRVVQPLPAIDGSQHAKHAADTRGHSRALGNSLAARSSLAADGAGLQEEGRRPTHQLLTQIQRNRHLARAAWRRRWRGRGVAVLCRLGVVKGAAVGNGGTHSLLELEQLLVVGL